MSGNGHRAKYDIQLDRHEAKYIIPRSMVGEIVDFITPFCKPDPYANGDPPEYIVTTLQLDSADYVLHYAKENEALNRFKLRVRTYSWDGPPGDRPVFMEVKKKIRGVIVKSRTMLFPDDWSRELIYGKKVNLMFESKREEEGFLEFVRLAREIDARPVVLIRYTRQSYFSRNDSYARVTFDRNLLYQPTDKWTGWGEGGIWRPIDSGMSQRKGYDFSGIVLELKTLSNAPCWMIDLVKYFGLERTGNCKYSTALWQESLFRGVPNEPLYAQEFVY